MNSVLFVRASVKHRRCALLPVPPAFPGGTPTSCLKPKYAPTKVRGTETPNHRARTATRVLKGTAADEPSTHRIRFMRKTLMNTMLPGERGTSSVSGGGPERARQIQAADRRGRVRFRRRTGEGASDSGGGPERARQIQGADRRGRVRFRGRTGEGASDSGGGPERPPQRRRGETYPGHSRAVSSTLLFHFSPPNAGGRNVGTFSQSKPGRKTNNTQHCANVLGHIL